MKGDRITYSNAPSRYKYKLEKTYTLQLQTALRGFVGFVLQPRSKRKVVITPNGMLHIQKGYLWDGPSGIARDTLTFMRGSLVHDALYHLLREGVLPKSKRRSADALMKKICLQDGMNPARAAYCYRAVRVGGKRSADHDKPAVIRMAPRKKKKT